MRPRQDGDLEPGRVLRRRRPRGPRPALQARIVGIESAGSAAMARLEALDWRGTPYTDFVVMIRRDGDWRIDSKVFHAHSRA